jgi:hypothetical protein
MVALASAGQGVASADEPGGPAPVAGSLRTSAIAAARLAGAANQDQDQDPAAANRPPDEPRAFFKSTRGLAVLAGLIGTAAYVLYSKSHDRVRSPIN